MKLLYCQNAEDWRKWLLENHLNESEIWLVYYKKGTGKPSVAYSDSVEEALCFAWVDSLIKKIDESKFARKFTPRKDNSKWSPSNKKRIEKLISEKRMTAIGMAKVEIAKKNGMWDKIDRPVIPSAVPDLLKQAFNKNKKAKLFFETLSLSNQKQYIAWIVTAKRPETKLKRVKESISMLEKGKKLGLR